MKMRYLVPAATALGVLLGGIIWVFAYSANHSGYIGYDGPAAMVLGMAMVGGGLIFGLASTVYAINKFKASAFVCFGFMLITGVFACVLVGYSISTYTMKRYPDGSHLEEPIVIPK